MSIISEEEKKAIEWLEKAEFFSARLYKHIILNLIKKQQKKNRKRTPKRKRYCQRWTINCNGMR